MVWQSDYSVSSLSLRDKEREREKREIELDNILRNLRTKPTYITTYEVKRG